MTTETELIFSPERTSNNSFHIFSSKKTSRRGAALHQPPKPVSCRVFRYFTPAAAIKPSNAVSVSTDSYGVVLESPFYTKSNTSTYWDQCFEHVECIGRGSFAEVYKVRNKDDNQLYAIKRSLTKFRGKSDRDQKLKEVRFHEALATHSNILKIIRAWEERERLYIQTELCESNLLEYAREHSMNQSMIWHLLYQISQALDFLHSLYYVHMDVKPENILITSDGSLKLCDFGIVHDLRSASTLAQDGDARYLAFEVLSGTISTAADVFSLGMAALELVSDYDMPVTGDLWTDIRALNLPIEIVSVLTDIHLKQLLYRMIHADYKIRPSAKEVLDSPTIRNQICYMPSPFAFNQHRHEHIVSSIGGNDSPASHGCRTPIKKPKRPPNYGGYHDEHSDDEFRLHSIHDKSQLTPPPAVVGDPLRVRLFPGESDEEINDDHIYFRKSPVQFKFDSSGTED
ncbi:unnamed protein product [Adineta steineri]|uniref:non-specific serine/threonine protein kinase n=2 Tax=Adineta steineri TaxID=433720 RepID=A0A818HGM5_9BILA|nr:unnamed protein product [Adineta steineri]CAF1119784.1 unnamed protein product [Adineta steineri]CAF3505974.1 unnamed protein product [Adineta steineri]